MGLNVSKGNMYDFVTHTWNTVKGKCPHNCSYCYMKHWGEQKPIRLDESELRTNLGEGNFIFVGSSCDLFAEQIRHGWISDTLIHCSLYPENKYLFQSKNPELIKVFAPRLLPPQSVLCTTIETNRSYEQMGSAPPTYERAAAMEELKHDFETYVTIEPILDFDLYELVGLIEVCGPEQVNIGADSGGNKMKEPSKAKILELIKFLDRFTTVKQKANLKRLLI